MPRWWKKSSEVYRMTRWKEERGHNGNVQTKFSTGSKLVILHYRFSLLMRACLWEGGRETKQKATTTWAAGPTACTSRGTSCPSGSSTSITLLPVRAVRQQLNCPLVAWRNWCSFQRWEGSPGARLGHGVWTRSLEEKGMLSSHLYKWWTWPSLVEGE